jgi:hypothetical protein
MLVSVAGAVSGVFIGLRVVLSFVFHPQQPTLGTEIEKPMRQQLSDGGD